MFPQLHPASTRRAQATAVVSSGVPELDALLGGGLNWGTSTVFTGPAGVGKSTIAAQYLCASDTSAKAAVFLFDERLTTFVSRCDALGMHASERIASGQLIAQQVEPGVRSPGEFSHLVQRMVEEGGVRLIGLDTLNGYINAIPTADASIVRMHELLSFLSEQSVATLIVLAQHGMVGTHMTAPVDLSYLADAIVSLRFFEAHGLIRKSISVIKKRTGTHETAIRELMLGPDRLRVGQPLNEFQGVLSGIPQYTGPARPLLRHEEPPAAG